MSDDVDALLRFISRAERLEALPRTGWLVCGIDRPESIAAHSYMVSVIALWIAETIPERVDIERLLRMALLHDVSEAMLTDLPSPVKQMLGKKAVERAEEVAAKRVMQGAPKTWLQAHASYEARDSIEAKIVKAADGIQLLAKAMSYEAQKRGDVSRFFDDIDRIARAADHPFVSRIVSRLTQMHEEGSWYPSDLD